MENYGYAMLGEMLIGLGKALKDPKSDLRKNFKLSREQMFALLGIIKVAASPNIQKKYIYEVAERWGVSERTIKNWIDIGLVRKGRKTAHDTRLWWMADELDEDERKLIKYGYIKPKRKRRMRYFMKMIEGFF